MSLESAAPIGTGVLQEKLTKKPQASCSSEDSENTTSNSERALTTEEDTGHEKADEGTADKKPSGAEHGARPRDTKRPDPEPVEDIEAFAKENRIAYKKKNSHCIVCDIEIPSSAERIREHVFGKKHKKAVVPKAEDSIEVHLRPQKGPHKKKNIYTVKSENELAATMSSLLENFAASASCSGNAPAPTIGMRRFVRSAVSVFEPQKMVINERFCVDSSSYQFFCQGPLALRCLVCERTLDRRSAGDVHINDDDHINAVCNTQVLQIKDEFIRKMKRELYHCGYCNMVAEWKNMQLHLQSLEHCDAKSECKMWLEKLLPVVRRHLRSLNPWDGPMSGTSIHGDIFLPR